MSVKRKKTSYWSNHWMLCTRYQIAPKKKYPVSRLGCSYNRRLNCINVISHFFKPGQNLRIIQSYKILVLLISDTCNFCRRKRSNLDMTLVYRSK